VLCLAPRDFNKMELNATSQLRIPMENNSFILHGMPGDPFRWALVTYLYSYTQFWRGGKGRGLSERDTPERFASGAFSLRIAFTVPG